MSKVLNETCPLCNQSNNCCNSKDKSLGICWCNEESFPREIFNQVPPDQLRKLCICKSCLEKFKIEH
ncbi:cysteine-rich CWC family protein [Sporosarcina sp. G11-34]|uniref:cysteine-rich CWC family protein n=1 Tax=Sporosarcina sp. G11-34 TaxID=2849605 RepID=UPI0022A9832B|nr:cysteine-rich CWC family protein [Sporosarcina sp. G11-34]MCZ2257378.1 cysteine-rich CWC family protein [Sporosarcina sp. G11-34]